MTKNKAHKRKKGGKKGKNKTNKTIIKNGGNKTYHKAFTFSGGIKSAHRRKQHYFELEEKKLRVTKDFKEGTKNSPLIVVIQGSKGVGKTTLLKSLIKYYANTTVETISGPISVITKTKKKYTFIEVDDNILNMIDIAKVADICVLVIDGSYGFELETLEFFSILNTHGMPKVLGVVTKMDHFKDGKSIRKRKKKLTKRFSDELFEGAKLFFLSGLQNNRYNKTEIRNLCKFLSVIKKPIISWREQHGYLFGLRVDIEEGISYNKEIENENKKIEESEEQWNHFEKDCDTKVCVHIEGYVYGSKIYKNQKVHITNIGDVPIEHLELLEDPFKNDEEKKNANVYAPMCDIGNISFDFDNMYIHIPKSKINFTRPELLIGDSEGGQAEYENKESSIKENYTKYAATEDEENESDERVDEGEDSETNEEKEKNFTESIRMIRELQNSNCVFSKYNEEDDLVLFEGENEEHEETKSERTQNEDENDNEEEIGGRRKAPSNIYFSEKQKKKKNPEKYVNKKQKEYEELQSILFEKKDDNKWDQIKEQIIYDNDNNDTTEQDSNSSTYEIDENNINVHTKDDSLKGEPNMNSLDIAEIAKILAFDNKTNLQSFIYDFDYINRKNNLFYFKGDLITVIEHEKEECLLNSSGDLSKLDKVTTHMIKNKLSTAPTQENSKGVFAYVHQENYFANQLDTFNSDRSNIHIFNNLNISFSNLANSYIMEEFFEKYEHLYDYCFCKDSSDEDEKEGEEGSIKSSEENEREEQEEEEEEEEEEGNEKGIFSEENIKKEKEEKLKKKEMFEETETVGVVTNAYGTSINIGDYVRIRVFIEKKKLFVLKNNFLIVGGLQTYEEQNSFIHCRIKKHRWYNKLLRSNDPLIFSVGWRKFQSIPVYSISERNNVRQRYLKYTTEHLHCNCTFYGPIAPVNSGVIAMYNHKKVPNFRISLNGVILETNNNFTIMKKLKLMGEPYKIFKNTAFVKNMFNSDLEVCKFINCMVTTPSGIKGIIKNNINSNGDFRCTFADKIKMSDLVILKLYVPVEIKKFCNFDIENKIRSINELRYLYNVYVNHNSKYRFIPFRHFYHSKIHINSKLLKQLPYRSKPKLFDKNQTIKEQDKERLKKKEQQINFKAMENPKTAARWYQMLHTIKKDMVSKKKQKAKVSYNTRMKKKLKEEEIKKKINKERKKNSFMKKRK